MSELNKLDALEQMPLVDALSAVEPQHPSAELGAFNRDGKTYYRLRVGDYRLYFEVLEEAKNIYCHHILHKHSVVDFAFRMGLPYKEEVEVEQHQTFWKYIASTLRK
ncbi:MAG: cytotoxic translational repressor of toxin-antitoxin stability system [Puniceicoccales bacterium]|nr:cytotoxic translational repressor of toxin-antitoxin stability system [Puniceicoccales bacterium]